MVRRAASLIALSFLLLLPRCCGATPRLLARLPPPAPVTERDRGLQTLFADASIGELALLVPAVGRLRAAAEFQRAAVKKLDELVAATPEQAAAARSVAVPVVRRELEAWEGHRIGLRVAPLGRPEPGSHAGHDALLYALLLFDHEPLLQSGLQVLEAAVPGPVCPTIRELMKASDGSISAAAEALFLRHGCSATMLAETMALVRRPDDRAERFALALHRALEAHPTLAPAVLAPALAATADARLAPVARRRMAALAGHACRLDYSLCPELRAGIEPLQTGDGPAVLAAIVGLAHAGYPLQADALSVAALATRLVTNDAMDEVAREVLVLGEVLGPMLADRPWRRPRPVPALASGR